MITQRPSTLLSILFQPPGTVRAPLKACMPCHAPSGLTIGNHAPPGTEHHVISKLLLALCNGLRPRRVGSNGNR